MMKLARILAAAVVFLAWGATGEAANRNWNPYAVTGVVAGGTGGTECLVSISPSISGSGLVTGDTLTTRSIGGATGCNVTGTITVRSSSTISLDGTTFGGAYTSGGCVDGGHWTATNVSNWASTSTATCGQGGQTVPSTNDFAIFDANSGGTTVASNVIKVDASVSGATIAGVTAGQLNGWLDFSGLSGGSLTCNNTCFAMHGTGTRKFTFPTMTINATCANCSVWRLDGSTNLDGTSSFSGVTWNIGPTTTASGQTFSGGASFTYGTINVTVTGRTGTGNLGFTGTGVTYAAINFIGAGAAGTALNVSFQNSTNTLITGGMTLSGFTASAPISIMPDNAAGQVTLVTPAVAINGAVLRGIKWQTSVGVNCTTCTATSSIDLLNNAGITITPPSSGGGGGPRTVGL